MPDGVAPTITTQPVSQTVVVGQTVSFTAAADGDQPLTVQWQVSTDGGASFSDITGATSTTLAFTVALAQSGNEYRAAFTNLAGSATTAAATLTVIPAPASYFILSGFPAQVTAGDATQLLTVTAYDAYCDVATGTSTDGQATLPANYTFTADDAGVHTFAGWVLRTSGTQFIIVSDTAQSTLFGAAPVLVVPAAPDHFTLTTDAANPDVAGTPFDLTVTVQDACGNTVTGYSGTVHFSSSDPQAALPADATLSNGTGTFGVTLFTAGTQALTATDTANGSLTGTQPGLTVTPAANHFGLTAPANVTSGVPFDVTVTVLDRYGNVDTNGGHRCMGQGHASVLRE